jgi:dissimilatory sulfite reductase (desulfoviridin) alpha/beta subunit
VEKLSREMKVSDAKATAASTDHDSLMKGLSMSVSDFFAENALEHERSGEMIERIGLPAYLELNSYTLASKSILPWKKL